MTDDDVFVVDENNNPLAPRPRSESIKEGLWRRTGGGIALDAKRGLILCHKRSASKDERPSVWVAAFGGKSDPEEPANITAARELREELGVVPNKGNMEFIGCIKSEERRQFEYIFLARVDSQEVGVHPDPNEVAEFRWLKIADVTERLQNDSGWFAYGFEINLLNSLAL